MKKIVLIYVILTLILSVFIHIININKNKEPIIDNNKSTEYKQSVMNKYPNMSEQEIDAIVDTMIQNDKQINKATGNRDTDFKTSLRTAAIISGIIIGVFILYFFLKTSYFNELFGESKSPLGNLFRFFFGKMR